MWLPTPIYERVPQFYVLVGLLLITDGLYLGFDFALSFFYFGLGFDIALPFFYLGLGFASFTYGVGLFILRMRYRKVQPGARTATRAVDSAAVAEESATPSEAFDGEITTEQSVQH
jgi:hypothetical protein